MKFFCKKKSGICGFTLIELLIVIAVLGVLSASVIIALNPAEKMAQARDSGRKSTMASLASALQAYYIAKGDYPAAGGAPTYDWISLSLVDSGELKNVPPFINYSLSWPNSSYCNLNRQNGYCYNTNGTNAYIYTRLESSSEQSKCGNPVDMSNRPWFLWSSCDGKTGLVCGYEPNISNVCNFTFQ